MFGLVFRSDMGTHNLQITNLVIILHFFDQLDVFFLLPMRFQIWHFLAHPSFDLITSFVDFITYTVFSFTRIIFQDYSARKTMENM